MSSDYVVRKTMGTVDTNPFWQWDNSGKLHMTFRATLDHDVDGELLREALEETYEVWPILKDAYIATPTGELCIVACDDPIEVHHTPSIVSPGAGRNNNRMAAVSYYGDTITYTGMHSFFDGGSVMLIIQDSLSRYLKKYYGDDLDTGAPLLEAGAGAGPEASMFYLENPDVLAMPFEYLEPIDIIKEVFEDPQMTYGPDLALARYIIECQNDDFVAFSKRNGANPSIMLFMLLAQAAYNLHPEAELPFTTNNTMNIRHALGLDKVIMGQTMGALLSATRQDFERPLSELAQRIRSSFNRQRGLDYILSRADDMRKGVYSLSFELSTSLQYMGRINFGEATKHLRRFTMYGDLQKNLMACELNGTFYINVLLGMASKDYAEEICRLLNEAGVTASITEHTEALPSEIR